MSGRKSPGGERPGAPRLAVIVDGVPMGDEEAREVWSRFSAYMEEHRGDLGGFAQSLGFVSAHPRSEGGRASLVLSRTAPQEPYGAPPAAPAKGRPRR